MLDVLIAGAGPAGALAALSLARSGARVLLVDRARFPRDKLCGDTLNPGALRILTRHGVSGLAESVGHPLNGMVLTDDRGGRVTGHYGDGRVGRALTRRVLDDGLVRAAVAAGAQFQDGVRVQGPLVDGGPDGARVCGMTLTARDGRPMRVPAAMTIAADGRRSTLALALGLIRQPRAPRRWAIGAYFDDVADLSGEGEMHVRRGYYIGVAPLGRRLVNVCLVAPRGDGFADPACLLQRRLADDPLLSDRFAGARRVTPVTVLGPLAVDAASAGVRGLLLAGDAAGFVDPMTGDGLRLALRGAELAAECTLAGLTNRERPVHEELRQRRSSELDGKTRVNRLLRRLVSSPRLVRTTGIVARAAPFLLEAVIRYEGDVHTI